MSDVGAPSPVPPAGNEKPTQVAPASGTGADTPTPAGTARAGTGATATGGSGRPHDSPAVTLAATLAGVPKGSALSAIVIGTDDAGRPVIRTATGTFTLSTPLPVPPETQIALQVQAIGKSLTGAIVSVGGQVLHPPKPVELTLASIPPQALAARPLTAGLRIGPSILPIPPAALAPGTLVSGIVVPGTAAAPPEAGPHIQTFPLAPGTPLRLQVVSVTPQGGATTMVPTPGSAVTGTPPVGTPVTGGQPAASGGPGAPAGGQPAAAQPGFPGPAAVTGRSGTVPPAASAAPPAAGETPVSSIASGIALSGTVTGGSPGGGLLVRTANGMIALDTTAALAPRTHLSLVIVADPVVAGAATTASAMAPGSGMTTGGTAMPDFASGWPALIEAVAMLDAVAPAVARQMVGTAVPSRNGQFVNSVLFFLAALRGGDARSWLGNDVARSLEQAGRRDLLARLGGDMQQLARATDMTLAGDWRALVFPFHDGQTLHQIWSFVRDHKREGNDDKQRALRFVVELELSALGNMQLDGLVRERRFDLIVRTVRGLDETIRTDITRIFTEAMAETGSEGSVAFRSGEPFPVSPLRDARHAGVGEDFTA
jgi:hypothetical protein